MDFVRGVGIPDDEFSVLRGRDDVSFVGCPMKSVDFGKMAFEGPTGFHGHSREGWCVVGHSSNCTYQ